jgi:hypothetical protein
VRDGIGLPDCIAAGLRFAGYAQTA